MDRAQNSRCDHRQTSRKTKKQDRTVKPELYRQLCIPEYFRFDPTEDYLDPPLQGYRLAEGCYTRIPADADGALIFEQLGLRLQPVQRQLMFYRVDTGAQLLTADEAPAKRKRPPASWKPKSDGGRRKPNCRDYATN